MAKGKGKGGQGSGLKGQGQGQGNQGNWAPGKGEGDGPGMGGPGQGAGGKAPENPHDVGLTKDRIKSQLGKGVIVGSWFTTGEPPSGKALAEYSDAQRTYSEEAKEALSKQKVPSEYQNYVREYFDSIRVPEKK